MTKSELRKQRKAARAAGQTWNLERREDGGLEIVHERTPAQERQHEARMERWARKYMDSDPDWR